MGSPRVSIDQLRRAARCQPRTAAGTRSLSRHGAVRNRGYDWSSRCHIPSCALPIYVTSVASVALFLDRHDAPGATAADVAAAHKLDLDVQEKYGVRYVTYWFDDDAGTVFCLAEGPDRESLEAVHREAHGLMANNIIEVGEAPINSYLGAPPLHRPGDVYVESAVRAILFTDLCDSTKQTQIIGDEGFVLLLHEHDEIVRSALHERGGREVKHTGDGIMASFSSASPAVEAGVDIQRRLKRRNETAKLPIHLRIGISIGEPVTERGDLFGATVQLSARLCSIAPPDGIAVSAAVRDLCVGKLLVFESRGAHRLKGFAERVPVFEVRFETE
jgi:class 3 adenylate cyclase